MASTDNYAQPAYSKAINAGRKIRESVGTVSTEVVTTRQIRVEIDPSSYEFDQRPDSIELLVNGRIVKRMTYDAALRMGIVQ